jgi:hypothetical protein
MKKAFMFLALLVILFSNSLAQAETFSLISSNFQISGSLRAQTFGFSDQYNNNSMTPIADEVSFAGAYAMSGASFYNVYINALNGGLGALVEYYGGEYPGLLGDILQAEAFANATLDFRPNFNGEGPTINFTMYNREFLHSYTSISLTDTTTSIELLSMGPTYSWGYSIPFTYSQWDSGHEYRLIMTTGSVFLDYFDEWGNAEVTTDIAFNNVPEPTTMLLIGVGLVGIAGIRRRMVI